MPTNNIEISTNGCFLVPEFSATGGVSYRRTGRRTVESGERLIEEFETRKEVDDQALVTESKSLINRAYATLERYAVHTPVGYWVDPEGELAVREGLVEIQETAADFNARARRAGCERRVTVAVYAVALVQDDAGAAKRLRETVLDRLTGLRDSLARADRAGFDKTWDRARGLDALTCGFLADAVRTALEVAKTRRTEITELVRDGLTAHEIGERLDLDALHSAISLFEG